MRAPKQKISDPTPTDLFLGVDVGSASVGCILLDAAGDVRKSCYTFHHGDIHGCLHRLLSRLPLQRIAQFGINPQGKRFFRFGETVNEQVALIRAVRRMHPHIQAILHIGAEKFGLILLDEKGRYKRFLSNTGCAAGTGSFLDQQASRLGLKDAAELSDLADRFKGEPPRIATRCAVFAKTDLIHAQQKGYGLDAICAGLCEGVARNILDTVTRGLEFPEQFIVTGGVALNAKVKSYLQSLTGRTLKPIPHPELAVAQGIALVVATADESATAIRTSQRSASDAPKPSSAPHPATRRSPGACSADDLLYEKSEERQYYYQPLSDLPYRMDDAPRFLHTEKNDVETDIYVEPGGETLPASLGIDIGSTSTKAILMGPDRSMLVGLYTRTRGRPIEAVQRILSEIASIEKTFGVEYAFLSAGTTGSGRKFIHRVLRSDLALDEISAHARAAVHLHPEIDTIIEIGGQDSKFTVIDRGRVVFSVMNTVCAAGTGSFLEEQAQRLGVSLEGYSEAAEQAHAPLTSDRCTVFMERDLNHMLHLGYKRDELLAAALHSVRDNYLTKVAHLQKIGEVITFQGATARNRALVKTFERKLGRPVLVSPYCHLTGAMGVCLTLLDRNVKLNHRFRKQFAKEKIVVTEVVCTECRNHCKLNRLVIGDDEILWGHLCGKEEGLSDVSGLETMGLIRNRDRILSDPSFPKKPRIQIPVKVHLPVRLNIPAPPLPGSIEKAKEAVGRLQQKFDFRIPRVRLFGSDPRSKPKRSGSDIAGPDITVGLPNTLYFIDTLPMWRKFFTDLGFRIVLSKTYKKTLEKGKHIAGAEFCTPISLLHGHADALLNRCDYLFMPVILQHRTPTTPKSYCYYSNYAVSLIQNNHVLRCADRIIAPLLRTDESFERQAHKIYAAFPEGMREFSSPEKIRSVLRQSYRWFQEKQRLLQKTTQEALETMDELGVILLGRPYLILDDGVNNRIPHRLAGMGLPILYQDMLAYEDTRIETSRDIVSWNHWFYGDMILRAAETIAQSPHIFPVYLTAFKCAPDSFLVPYFRDVLDRYGKPYLILQLDEHHSVEGYDTRLESAVETFRNFREGKRKIRPVSVSVKRQMEKKTYLLPNFDPVSTKLVCAAFLGHGIQALPILETEETVKASVRLNDGQCLPISALAQAIAHSIRVYRLPPEETAVYVSSVSRLSCNFPQYPVFLAQLLERLGEGMEKIDVYATTPAMAGLSIPTLIDVYQGYLLGGLLNRLVCRIRPREARTGSTDTLLETAVQDLGSVIRFGGDREALFEDIVDRFGRIEQRTGTEDLPKAAIIGDLYVRDNSVFNQNLTREIEAAGAEVITTPYNDIIRLTSAKHLKILAADGDYLLLALHKALLSATHRFDRKYFEIAAPVLKDKLPDFSKDFSGRLSSYHLTIKHLGESAQNVLKIFHLLDHYPDLRLFVHVNPVFCCPALVSESLFKKVEQDTGVPIVSITYDGTQTPHNRVLAPYLYYLREEKGKERAV